MQRPEENPVDSSLPPFQWVLGFAHKLLDLLFYLLSHSAGSIAEFLFTSALMVDFILALSQYRGQTTVCFHSPLSGASSSQIFALILKTYLLRFRKDVLNTATE